ncbi:hypothetical protein CA267_006630 [Alteromonas pelagimontana]|uniref:Uncharacterized protein n=1 Tax=Alteromonas pelagimontana TaxID=1858656 RepID=A0A6M4MBA1_9ALTE|nr:DUF6136 family protein [Alteromonas pelagimontana]QJR80471.1 hypothetical protein CA267_006630 [Alteromonas pelagimontana]
MNIDSARVHLSGLLAFPLVAFIWAQELTKLQWLLLWSAAIFIEHHIPAISLTLGRWPKGPLRLFLQADIASPEGEKFRLISLLLLITLTRVSMTGLHADVQPYLFNLVSFLTALVLASSLFGTQTIRLRYELYLTTLPNKKFPLLIESIFYVFMKTSVGIFLLFLTDFFGATQWSLWFVFYLGTIAGILWRPQWFLLFPCVIAVGAFLFSMAG